jgi:hypothetical protein
VFEDAPSQNTPPAFQILVGVQRFLLNQLAAPSSAFLDMKFLFRFVKSYALAHNNVPRFKFQKLLTSIVQCHHAGLTRFLVCFAPFLCFMS